VYLQRVIDSRMSKPDRTIVASGKSIASCVSTTNPYVDHLIFETAEDGHQDGTPAASFIQATWPIATDEQLKYAVTDVVRRSGQMGAAHGYTPFRLSRWFEALDALTADVAYRHTGGSARGLVMVTASHYNSIKLRRTVSNRDLTIRCYVTSVSSSSLEVRTDALQVDEQGNEYLVNVCHTAMVALDKATMRPCKGSVPPLVLPPTAEETHESWAAHERLAIARMHKARHAQERAVQMSTRSTRYSKPPTTEEMTAVHELHRKAIAAKGSPAPRIDLPDEVQMHTHESVTVVFPDSRNVHDRAFGGFIIRGAYDLAYLAARYFTRGQPFVPVGIDDAIFVQPVGIGDMVRFTGAAVELIIPRLGPIALLASLMPPSHTISTRDQSKALMPIPLL
jgi:acyl-CoA hydrolase